MDFDPTPFQFSTGFMNWLRPVLILAIIGMCLGMLGAVRSSKNAPAAFMGGLKSWLADLMALSPRRIYALAVLTLKECVRRKALFVFLVFAPILMLGGWYLNQASTRVDLQRSLHVTFMLTVITNLVFIVILFLSCWGIPEDIRLRSMHTVVTKPARRVEIVIGRIIGISSLAFGLLLVMGVTGLIWIQRQYPAAETEAGQNPLECRVPQYGSLTFINNEGLPTTSGVNVGDPWMYRSFVQGSTDARAVWHFAGITPDRIGDTLRMESRFEAFRTIKGDDESIENGIEVQYTLVNDLRAECFAALSIGTTFRPFGDAMRAGDFEVAADILDTIAKALETAPETDFPNVDFQNLENAILNQTVPELKRVKSEFADLIARFQVLATEAGEVHRDQSGDRAAACADVADPCRKLAAQLRKDGEALFEEMPSIRVPLKSFRMTEFHEGQDQTAYNRVVIYAPDQEGATRFFAQLIGDMNEAGRLVQDGGITTEIAPVLLEANDRMEPEDADNLAEKIEQALQSELDAGTLEIQNGKLVIVDGRRWLRFVRSLINEEKLIPQGLTLKADIYEDLVRGEQDILRVEVACLDDMMYLGMARSELFIRLDDASFSTAYAKAILNIALMLGVIIVIGVQASCIVKGPVSLVFTLTIFIIGQSSVQVLINEITGGQRKGTGMIESAVMIAQHKNESTGIDASRTAQKGIELVDNVGKGFLGSIKAIIPNFSTFTDGSSYLSAGFDVPWNSSVLPSLLTYIGFLIPSILMASAYLKFRELESK